MKATSSFKEQFYSLCELLGENISTLSARLGQSNDNSEDEHRAFICFQDSHAVFRVKNKLVDHLTVPLADAYGHGYAGPKDFYSLDGVELGMTKEEIITQWGEPSSRKYMCYENKITKTGKTFTIGFSFKEGEDNKYHLSAFTAYPYIPPTFEKLFIELSELLGCNEDTIVDFIGKPDNTSTNEFGTKFIFYEKFKALFTISSDLHIAEFVSCPKANVEGVHLKTTDSFYNFQGVKLGDTHDAIQKNWGSPTRQATYVWTYGRKSGITKNKNQYEIALEFDHSGNANILIGFEGRLKEIENEVPHSTTEKPKGGCFIATACYGDYDASEVLRLRQYRDNVLLKSYIGKVAVNIYYLLSPPLSKLIAKSDKLKNFIRKYLLNPIISKISKRQNH